jgi:hypothetical protein
MPNFPWSPHSPAQEFPGTPEDPSRLADEVKAVVFGVVVEVLRVERCQGKLVDEAAGGDPGVADRAGAPELGVGLQLAPLGCYGFVNANTLRGNSSPKRGTTGAVSATSESS